MTPVFFIHRRQINALHITTETSRNIFVTVGSQTALHSAILYNRHFNLFGAGDYYRQSQSEETSDVNTQQSPIESNEYSFNTHVKTDNKEKTWKSTTSSPLTDIRDTQHQKR